MNTQYLRHDNGYIKFSGHVDKLTRLDSGAYNVLVDPYGNAFLDKFVCKTDSLISIPGSPSEYISAEVDKFLSDDTHNKFKKYDLIYKRGLLMHGIPGTGKTSIVHLLMGQAVEKDMIILLNPDPYHMQTVVANVRMIEKNSRPFMIIWEEFENLIARNEAGVLNVLDGISQMDNMFFIATTNYIELIPPRIKNRPSRFADIIEIGTPGKNLRREYIKSKVKEEDDIDLDEWVDKTEGLTIDHIKDVVVSVLVLDKGLDESINKMRAMFSDEERHTARVMECVGTDDMMNEKSEESCPEPVRAK